MEVLKAWMDYSSARQLRPADRRHVFLRRHGHLDLERHDKPTRLHLSSLQLVMRPILLDALSLDVVKVDAVLLPLRRLAQCRPRLLSHLWRRLEVHSIQRRLRLDEFGDRLRALGVRFSLEFDSPRARLLFA